MNKIWINTEKGDDKIIALSNNKILKANPKENMEHQYEIDIKNDVISNDVLSIPFSYIKSIQLQDNKKYIQVFFGQESEEYLKIKDDTKRKEIFDYFKDNIPLTTYRVEKYSNSKKANKPLIAGVVIFVLYLWTVYLAAEIETGSQYEVIGNQRSIASIVLVIAQLGVIKVTLIFGSLLTIAVYSYIRKIRNKANIHVINIIG
jgi:hypothetical protein